MTTLSSEPEQAPLHTFVSVVGTDAAVRRAPSRTRRPRSKKKGKRAKSVDGRRKTLSKGITSKERKNLLGADGFARLIRRPLNTTLDFQPCHLTDYPAESLDGFFAELRMRISTWLRRKGIMTYWVWTRENYESARREHLHIVMHLPPRFRTELEDYIRRLPRYRGNEYVVRIGERRSEFNPITRRWEDGLQYRMKQLRGDAVGAPGPTRLNRETKSRYDGDPVAPVLGQRCGVSETLSHKTEQAWRASHQEHFTGQPEGRFASLKSRIEFHPSSEPQTQADQGVHGQE